MRVAEQKTRTTSKVERLEARISREAKKLCQKAAKIQGCTLTDFVVNSAVEAAKRTVRENELLELTYRDRLAFVEALLGSPAAPNAKVRKDIARRTQSFQD